MSRLTRLARRVGRRVGRKLRALVPEPSAPPSVPLTVAEDTGSPLLRNVWFAPAFGVAFDDDGRVFARTAEAALRFSPTLASLPNTCREAGRTLFTPPGDAPVLSRATVFMDWSATHNHAHFLLGALPALLAARGDAMLARQPAVAPPLTPWQADLLALAGEAAPVTIDAPLARLEEAAFVASPTPAPGPHLDLVRTRILAAIETPAQPPRRIYVSRRDSRKAVMENEAELEAALAARGFTIVRPETASVRALAGLFRGAETIVAASGTALSNVLFCAPGARVVEIQPPAPGGAWVRDLAAHVGGDWRGFVSETGIEANGPPLDLRPASAFGWRLDLPAFLAFLDGEG